MEMVPQSARHVARRALRIQKVATLQQAFDLAISFEEAAAESRDQAFGTGTCSPVWIASI